ncbi:MAG: Ig-like domain-containing protein, partial [Dermatophilaceae bacterium]
MRRAPRPRPFPRRLAAALTAIPVAGAAALSAAVPQASADPGPIADAVTVTAPGPYSGIVPDSVCAVTAAVRGAAGGHAAVGDGVSVPNANGPGSVITATYTVVPGMTYAGTVGGGGRANGDAGSNGGGPGGTTPTGDRRGAGGGGWTDLQLGGQLVVLAGGGGGSGSGRSTVNGFGGAAGVSLGFATTYPASTGGSGRGSFGVVFDSGGRGGGTGAPGSGGQSAGDPVRAGSAGSGRTGGAGGSDADLDSGGGGGGGYYGGGGGGATIGTSSGTPTPNGITGSGGGGGASYASSIAPDGSGAGVTIFPGGVGERRATAGDGADGSVTLTWVPCLYELAVSKSADVTRVPVGSPITWTVTVQHVVTDEQRDSPMGRGDVLTIRDTLPGAGATTITSISTTPGDPQVYESEPLTCSAGVGDPMPATLVCSRPYSASVAGGSPSGGVRGLDRSESITITYVQEATGPAGVLSNTASIEDRTTVVGGGDNSATAEVEVFVGGVLTANPDTSSGTQSNGQQAFVLDNDTPSEPDVPIDPTSLTLIDADGDPVSSLLVPGQGFYEVTNVNGLWRLSFSPDSSFSGTADPVTYRITDAAGATATSTYTPTVTAVLFPDTSTGPQGVPQSVDPVANDDPAATGFRLIDPANGQELEEVTVPGQGTYTVAGGRIVFTPLPTFVGTATPATYQAFFMFDDNIITSTYTPTVTAVTPVAEADTSSGPQGEPQSVDPLANDDPGNPAVPLDPATLTLLDDAGDPATTVTVPAQGGYTVTGGRIVFTPLPTFIGAADPVTYRVADANGTTATSTYTPTVLGDQAQDVGRVVVRAPAGTTVTLDPSEDVPGLLPASVRLVGAGGEPVTELVVAG